MVCSSDYIDQVPSAFASIVRFGDVGFTVGDSNDLKVSIENGNEGAIANEIGTKITLKVNSNNVVTSIAEVNADGIMPGTGNKNIGASNDQWYEVHANYFKGLADNASGIYFGNQSYLGATTAVNNTVALRDGTGTITANTFDGVATSANYADLAEIYSTDKEYEVGTVMAIGGDAETTEYDKTKSAFGVISKNPGFLMNKDAEGQAIAFVGRVPVKVKGAVSKGDKVFADDGGVATTTKKGELIGFALETDSNLSTKLVEVALRLINNSRNRIPMALITANRFNTLRQSVDNVLGNGAGDTGYGQTLTSSTINVGDIITAGHINAVYEDLRKSYKHQNGGDPANTLIQAVTQGDLVKDTDGVNYTGWDQYEALASNISTNRLTVAGTQQSIATAMTRSRGSWNGTILQVPDVSFASADARRHFFNQGGFIRIIASTSDGSSLGNSWQNMFNTNAGNVDLKAHSTTRSGSGGSVSGALGNYELSGSYQYIYQNFDAGGGAYSANDYYIEAYAASSSLIKIRQTWRDQKGGNPDENVSNLTATIQCATAITDVIGTAPGVSSGSGTTL